MFALTNKPEMGSRLYSGLVQLASEPGRGTDVMKVIQHIAGVLAETYFVFDEPDEAMACGLGRLSDMLGCGPWEGRLPPGVLPPSHVIDRETERGRMAARIFFEEWLDCTFEFHELMLVIVHNIILQWEADGQPRAETLRLLQDCLYRCMAYEIAAQELCDIAIERKIMRDGWSMGDCMASLSGQAGWRLALSSGGAARTPEQFDKVVFVMTQEAVRQGVPAGSDWRFGLPANDTPLNPPLELIEGMEPYCHGFFRAVSLPDYADQAVACAKAAGRMVALAAGGEAPDMEPVIAKPLALAAMTETYKSACLQSAVATY